MAPLPLRQNPPNNFPVCMAWILAREGGYVNDPHDRGGATKFGITQATLAAWRGHPVTAEDVAALSVTEASAIYQARYWTPLRCPELPPGVDLSVLDAGVMSGPKRAIQFLQRAASVADDGVLGPHTMAAVSAARPAALVDAIAAQRSVFYHSLVDDAVFLNGWLNRTKATRERAMQMATAI